jgi:CRP-like cAMP-binding protein/flavin-dependent dehydrogenase
MKTQARVQSLGFQSKPSESELALHNGSRIAVIGGGPAGSFFSFFALDMANRKGLDIEVDIYEPRDFSRPGPAGCNMCGGIVSESLVQNLSVEGISLPSSVVQRGIDSYVLHMDVGSVHINTPLQEKRIGAVYRGPGPRDLKEFKWGSFDGHLQQLAVEKGARVIQERVGEIGWANDRPEIKTKEGPPKSYDLLVVSAGVNTAALKLFQELDIDYQPPGTTKTFIREFYLGEEEVSNTLGSSMHVFLLDIPRLEFAAIIPKGDYVSLCLLGEEIDKELIDSFLESPEVKQSLPPDLDLTKGSCQCSPRINIKGAFRPYGDRIVFIGDSGVTRLFKDGIGAAYRTAKAAAATAIFSGVAEADFRQSFLPTCKSISRDNSIGKVVFGVASQIQHRRFARRALLRMTRREQEDLGAQLRMSTVLWDMFTGSAPYREILMRTILPAFWLRFGRDLIASLFHLRAEQDDQRARRSGDDHDISALGKSYQPGDILLQQGQVNEGMHIILAGQVALMYERDGKETFLGVRGTGEVLGETEVLEKDAQMAKVVALSPVRLLTVDKENFTRRINEDPSMVYRLFQLMSRRQRELSHEVVLLNQEIDKLTERSNSGR